MDKLDPARRSENMRQIRSKNTKPEIFVRRLARSMGLTSYRLHETKLPGNPDLVWRKEKIAIFVNGCFWHGHTCKIGKRRPKSRLDYWLPKIERTQKRDKNHRRALKNLGWQVLTVWECQLQDVKRLEHRISDCFKN